MHSGNGDMTDLGRRFVDCFVGAMDDAGLPDDPEFRAAMRAYMESAVVEFIAYPDKDAEGSIRRARPALVVGRAAAPSSCVTPLWHIPLLIGAGLVAGLTGSIAGLASLASYPALLAVGLTPLTANVTNTVALVFSSAGSIAGSRAGIARPARTRDSAQPVRAGGRNHRQPDPAGQPVRQL